MASKTKDQDTERKKRRSKDRNTEKGENGDDDDEMWVEKAVPEVVQKIRRHWRRRADSVKGCGRRISCEPRFSPLGPRNFNSRF